MRRFLALFTIATICGVLLPAATSPVLAGPNLAPSSLVGQVTPTADAVQTVRYRRYDNRRYGYGNRYRHRRNGNAGLALGAAIIGGAILSEAARANSTNTGSDQSRCAETYRSYERSTGMYTGYDGIRRPCPYLN